MGLYDEEVALAYELIAESGDVVTLRSFATATPVDSTKPWRVGDPSKSDQTGVPAVFLNYQQKYIDGEVIKRGDKQVLIPAENLTAIPNIGDQLIQGSQVWTIKNIEPLSPSGQDILYTLQVRQ